MLMSNWWGLFVIFAYGVSKSSNSIDLTQLDHENKKKFGNTNCVSCRTSVSVLSVVVGSLVNDPKSTYPTVSEDSVINSFKNNVRDRGVRELDSDDTDVVTATFLFYFPRIDFTVPSNTSSSTSASTSETKSMSSNISSSTSASTSQTESMSSNTLSSTSVSTTQMDMTYTTSKPIVTDNIIIPPWFLCLILKPPPRFCDQLNEIDGVPITIEPSTTCVTLVHSYPGIPPFHFPKPPPDCCPELASRMGGRQNDECDDKKEMLLHLLCTLLRAPAWCPDAFRDENEMLIGTTDKCDDVTDIEVPPWVLCFVFKLTPPFCKKYSEYDGTQKGTVTCATMMYSGIPPFPPAWPHPPIIWPPCEDQRPAKKDKDLPWWILCPFIKPVPHWCPDIFRCYQTPLTKANTETVYPTFKTVYPWWKLCAVMDPRPKECQFITPPPTKTTVNPDDPSWWVCLMVKPAPEWCKYITFPPSLQTQDQTVSGDTSPNYKTTPYTVKMDTEYPLWWMCIILKPPPYWCSSATFPPNITNSDYQKDVEDGKEKVSFFMYCWWWLCDLFKPLATWCQNLPPPPKNLIAAFKNKMPSEFLEDLPIPPLVIEFP